MTFFANLFGYLLNFIYNIVENYGIAIIIFSIIIKLIMIPISIKQQKTMKKNAKMQEKMKEIQFKYKNNPEKLNQATMDLYREEKINPFSGCFSAILQLVLLLAVFYLVRQPLTYMRKEDPTTINKYNQIMQEEKLSTGRGYPEIDIIREIDRLEKIENEKINNEELKKLKINMDFLGLDLSQIPSQNKSDWKVFIIPILYVLVSFVSMKISLGAQEKPKKLLNEAKNTVDGKETDNIKDETENLDFTDAIQQTNQNMSMIFPIMYLAVAVVAPLGLALYWLVNSLLMIIERLILNKVVKDDE